MHGSALEFFFVFFFITQVKTFTFWCFFKCSALRFYFFTCHKIQWKFSDTQVCGLGSESMMEADETSVSKDSYTLRHDVELFIVAN